MSQICELLLTIGVDAYEKEGTRYLQRVLAAQKKLKSNGDSLVAERNERRDSKHRFLARVLLNKFVEKCGVPSRSAGQS